MNSCTLLEIIAVRSESAVHLHWMEQEMRFLMMKDCNGDSTELHINFRFRFDPIPPLPLPPSLSLSFDKFRCNKQDSNFLTIFIRKN